LIYNNLQEKSNILKGHCRNCKNKWKSRFRKRIKTERPL